MFESLKFNCKNIYISKYNVIQIICHNAMVIVYKIKTWENLYPIFSLSNQIDIPHSSRYETFFFSTKKYWQIPSFSTKTYVVGTLQKRLGEALLTSTHNIFSSRNKKSNFSETSSYLEL